MSVPGRAPVGVGSAPLLEMCGIVKSFPGVRALRGVDLRLNAGEVLALLGENGAGKSTLIKVLGGAFRADEGSIRMLGSPIELRTPHAARSAGVAIIHQEFNLIPALTAVENIFLGQERTTWGFTSRRGERAKAGELLRRLGVAVDLDVPCRRLSTAQQQLVEIVRALAFEARVLVMDEPTAALTTHEVDRLFALIRELKKQGLGIVYVSHRLDEIFAIADRAMVLRDGVSVGERAVSSLTREMMIEMMVGRELRDEFPKRKVALGEPVLTAKGLCRGTAVRDVSLEVRRGEIVALTGLVGAGRTETLRLIFGADRWDAGEVRVKGQRVRCRKPSDAIRAGIGLLTEDRKWQGLVLKHSVRENFSLPNLGWLSRRGFVRRRQEREEFGRHATRLKIRVSSPEQWAGTLSGGNQQKVVLAKWLARDCDVLIFDEPTRGIDVGARYEIYMLMNDLVAQGKGVLMVSSELPEVLGMADRILVMRDGRLTGEIKNSSSVTQQDVMRLAMLES